MSEDATEELLYELTRCLSGLTGTPTYAAASVLEVLRADPSAVIAALGGTKLTPGRMSQRGNAEYWVPNDLPVWVLGEQP